MTTEEIIQILKIAQAEVEWDYPMDFAAAIDEVIEALRYMEFTSNTKDLINRREAIQAIRERADSANTLSAFWEGLAIAASIVNGLPAFPISLTQMSGTCQSHIRRAKTMIEWKPVSTPPAEKEIVLVTCKYLKIPIMAMYKNGQYLLTESQTPLPLTAVAWTPMPEVYHGA